MGKCEIQTSMVAQCNNICSIAGHGTMMGAVAAGNVTLKDEFNNELMPENFIDCPIIMVNTTGKMDAFFDAVSYISRKAEQMQSKCVINFSYCKHIGSHDSKDMYLRALDSSLGDNSILVVSAGNEGMKNNYTRREFFPRSVLEFVIEKHYYIQEQTALSCKVEIEVWYPLFGKRKLPQLSLISPQGKIYGPVECGENALLISTEGTVFISNGYSQMGVGKCSAMISISSNGVNIPPDGQWAIVLEKSESMIKSQPNDEDNLINAWITKSEKANTGFITVGKPINSISFLAFGQKTISVGSWARMEGNVLKEANFSNSPCKMGYYNIPFPTVLAPGRLNISVPGISEPYEQIGTSISTALITRYIALLWNENQGLTVKDIKNRLSGKVMIGNSDSYAWQGMPGYRLMDIFYINSSDSD